MALAVKTNKAMAYPMLICDGCGEMIQDWYKAIVTWDGPTEDGTITRCNVYHKVSCDQRQKYSNELSQYLPWLLSNHKWGNASQDKDGDKVITIQVPRPIL